MKTALNIHTLFEQISNDNPKAFELFFDYTYLELNRYVSYFVGDREVCKEIVSDIYLGLWQNRKKMPEIKDYKNYLFVCAKNQSYKYYRENDRYQTIRFEDPRLSNLAENTNPEKKMLLKELESHIELAINSLPQRCRLIFVMVREEGMKYKDIATVLLISERTVHAQMCIAIKKIGKIIQDYKYQTVTKSEDAI